MADHPNRASTYDLSSLHVWLGALLRPNKVNRRESFFDATHTISALVYVGIRTMHRDPTWLHRRSIRWAVEEGPVLLRFGIVGEERDLRFDL